MSVQLVHFKMGTKLTNSRNAQISVTILLFIFSALSIFHRKAENPFIHEPVKTFKQVVKKTDTSVQFPECSQLVSEYVENAGRVNISEQVLSNYLMVEKQKRLSYHFCSLDITARQHQKIKILVPTPHNC